MKRLFTDLRQRPARLCCALAVMVPVLMMGCASHQPEHDPAPQSAPAAPPAAVSKRAPSASLDKYKQQVTNAVASQWKIYVKLYPEVSPSGRIRVNFYVDSKGTPQDVKITCGPQDTHPALIELTLRAILDAQIPPIPPDLLPKLENGRVKIEYEALVYY